MNNIFDLRSFFNFLDRNKGYTAIDVFGLSLSLMFVILIAIYVERELSIDRDQTNADCIWAISSDSSFGTAVPVGYWLEERYPEIERVCPVLLDQVPNHQVYYGDKKVAAAIAFVDSTFFDMFSYRILEGDRNRLLVDPYSAVISQTFARTLFGSESPIGKSIRLSDKTSVTVTGLMEDIDRSAIPYRDLICRIERVTEFNGSLSKTSEGNAGSCLVFLQTTPGADLNNRADDVLTFFKERFWVYEKEFMKEVRFTKLRGLYFADMSYMYDACLQHGDRQFTLVLLSVGLLILIFSITNYINLTVAQAALRAKEMATRRLFGSTRTDLFLRLMLEAAVLTVASFIVGLFFAYCARHYAAGLLQVPIKFDVLLSPLWIGVILGVILLTSVLAGLLPAILISAAKPIEVVRGTFRRQTKMVFSKVFITFQNVITIVMLVASLTMFLQINHLIHAPLGYNTTNIIESDNVFRSATEMSRAEDMLRQLPQVKAIGHTNGTPASGTNNWSGTFEERSVSFQQMTVDSAAFRIFGLRVKQDNKVANSGDGWWLNELAFKQMDLPEDALSFTGNGEAIPILGVLHDFQLRDITMPNSPLMLCFNKPQTEGGKWWPWSYVIEVQGDPVEAFDAVRKVFEEVSGVPFEGEYTDQAIQSHFEQSIRLAKIVVVFACVAVLISFLGLLAMSTYFIRQRAQEVAIRKVFGSESREILRRLIGTFLSYVGIAFVIAVPISYYFMSGWLADYAYRIALSPLIFLAGGVFCLLISFLTVFYQSWRAANANPVESLKSN